MKVFIEFHYQKISFISKRTAKMPDSQFAISNFVTCCVDTSSSYYINLFARKPVFGIRPGMTQTNMCSQ